MFKIEVVKTFTWYENPHDGLEIQEGFLEVETNNARILCKVTSIDADNLVKAAVNLCSEKDDLDELFISTLRYFKERMGIESFSDSIQNYGGDLPEHEWRTLCSYFNLA